MGEYDQRAGLPGGLQVERPAESRRGTQPAARARRERAAGRCWRPPSISHLAILQQKMISVTPSAAYRHAMDANGRARGVVKPRPLGYTRPESVAEALAALAAPDVEAKVLAGGQSLVPLMSMRLAAPDLLVDINRLTELSYVEVADGQVRRRRARATRRGAGEPGGGSRPAAPAQGAPVRRAPGHPQPRHDRRQHRARRPGRARCPRSWRCSRAPCASRSAARRAVDPGQRVLPRTAGVGRAAGRARHRGAVPGAPWPRRRHRVHRDQPAARRLRGLRRRRDSVAATPTAASAARRPRYLSVAPSPAVLDLTEAVAGAAAGRHVLPGRRSARSRAARARAPTSTPRRATAAS